MRTARARVREMEEPEPHTGSDGLWVIVGTRVKEEMGTVKRLLGVK